MKFAIVTLVVAQLLSIPVQAAPPGLIIDHANILPMTGAVPIMDASVIIRDGKIAAILARGERRPRGLRAIDASGKWLIPGLTDAHVHLESDGLTKLFLGKLGITDPAPVDTQNAVLSYLANGVTQIFNLAAMPDGFAQKAEIASGKVQGPTILSAAMIDGNPPIWPLGMTRVAVTPEEGRATVRQAAAEGYQMVKVYSQLNLETFTAIVDEARKLNLPVVGHIPGRRQDVTEKFFQPGFGMVAHAEEFAQQTALPDLTQIPRYVAMTKSGKAGLIATLTLDDRLLEEVRDPESLKARGELAYLHPAMRLATLEHNPYVARATPDFIAALEKIVAFNRALVKAFAAAGIPILAGTDSGVPGVVPGFALQDELAALVAAGLTSEQALTAATRAPCEWLKQNCGTVEAGKRADLLLLDANPLADIANSRKINALILGGRYIARRELDSRMAALAAKAN